MNKKTSIGMGIILVLVLAIDTYALMSSDNYKISSETASSGSANMSSANFQNSVFPGFLSEQMESDFYKAYKGFVYATITESAPTQANITNTTAQDYNSNITINVTPSTDANKDTLTYFWFRNTSTDSYPNLVQSGTTATSYTTNETADGTYHLFVNVSDGAVNITGSLWSWTLDTQTPTLSNVPLNGTLYNEDTNETITAEDTNLFEINWTVYDLNGNIKNSTNVTNIPTTTFKFNVTILTAWGEAQYNLTVWAGDSKNRKRLFAYGKYAIKSDNSTLYFNNTLSGTEVNITFGLENPAGRYLPSTSSLGLQTQVQEVNGDPFVPDYFKFISSVKLPNTQFTASVRFSSNDPIMEISDNLANHLLIGSGKEKTSIDAQDLVDNGFSVTTWSDGTYYYWRIQKGNNTYVKGQRVTFDPRIDNLNIKETSLVFIIDTSAPNISLQLPLNNSGDSDGNITFIYNVTDSNNINNCSLIINNKMNITSASITKDTRINFTLNNTAIGTYNWSINCTDEADNTKSSSVRNIVVALSTEFNGTTTDLTAVDIKNITNFTIENSAAGKINFTQAIDLSSGADINRYVNISSNRIEINSTALPALNKSATLHLYGLTFTNPRILRDGSVCPSTICTEVSYNKAGGYGNLTFNITQFTVYSTEETPAAEEAAAATAAGGGAAAGSGGAAITPIKVDFSLDKEVIRVSLVTGQGKTEKLRIKNTGGTTLNFEIKEVDIGEFVIISEDSFSLKTKESKTVNIDFYAAETVEPAVYMGKLIVKADGIEKIVNIIIEVKEKRALFDIKVEVPDKYKEVNPGQEVKADIILYNLGTLKPVDVAVYYSIKDMEGNDIIYEHETFAVEEQKQITRKLRIPKETPEGHYLFYARLEYLGASASSSALIKVTTKKIKAAGIKEIMGYLAILLIISSILLFAFTNRKQLHDVFVSEKNLLDMPNVWWMDKTIGKIEDLYVNERFKLALRKYRDAMAAYLEWPIKLKDKHPEISKKFIDLQNKYLLEQELSKEKRKKALERLFRRELITEIAKKPRLEKLKPEITPTIKPKIKKKIPKIILLPTLKKEIVKIKPIRKKPTVTKEDLEKQQLMNKIKEWKANGYNTTLLEKELGEYGKKEIPEKEESKAEIIRKIEEWKAKGYNTELLEKELKIQVKTKKDNIINKIKEWKAKGYNTKILEEKLKRYKE